MATGLLSAQDVGIGVDIPLCPWWIRWLVPSQFRGVNQALLKWKCYWWLLSWLLLVLQRI